MTETTPPIPDDDAVLAELMAMDLTAVRHVHAELLAATETDEINSLARTYQRVARSLRQTLALKARFKAGGDKAAAPASRLRGLLDEMAIERRTQELQDAIGRVAAASWPGDRQRQDAICDDFDWRLDDEIESPDFLTLPVNDLVRAFCTRLDLSDDLAVRWRHLPLAPIWSDDEADPQPAAPLSEAEPPIPDTG